VIARTLRFRSANALIKNVLIKDPGDRRVAWFGKYLDPN
jgi:hypothetical protein